LLLPRNGPAGLEETVYVLDYQGARIVSLNSNERQAEQVPWLRKVLSENRQRWTILTFHHPIFSPAKGRDNAALRELWKPVFDEFKVDLVLTGHDHTYARSGDVSNRVRVGIQNVPDGYNQAYDPAIGTVYVVSVSGPKMYDLSNDAWAVRTAEDTQLFQIITVDGNELRYTARTATSRLYDEFTLVKRAGQPNQLVESLPPERRRTGSR
jgi:3',5'-cyclic AMP phosphodiesterase CpdA